MYKYDVLRDTWIYQEIQQEVHAELQQQHLAEHREMALEIVQARFPRVELLARKVVECISDEVMLRRLVVTLGTAKTEKEARQGLLEVGGDV
jgi:predicted transposase YdaD